MNTRLHRTRWLVTFTLAALCLALGGVTAVKIRTEVQRARYDLGELEARTRELQDQVEQLRREAQTLAAHGRIESLARKQGMIRDTPDAWIDFDPRLAHVAQPGETFEP